MVSNSSGSCGKEQRAALVRVFSSGNWQVACEEAIATDAGVGGQAPEAACLGFLQLNLESKNSGSKATTNCILCFSCPVSTSAVFLPLGWVGHCHYKPGTQELALSRLRM